MKTYLGVDVGSLTCKFVLIDEKNEVLYSDYFELKEILSGLFKKA